MIVYDDNKTEHPAIFISHCDLMPHRTAQDGMLPLYISVVRTVIYKERMEERKGKKGRNVGYSIWRKSKSVQMTNFFNRPTVKYYITINQPI